MFWHNRLFDVVLNHYPARKGLLSNMENVKVIRGDSGPRAVVRAVHQLGAFLPVKPEWMEP